MQGQLPGKQKRRGRKAISICRSTFSKKVCIIARLVAGQSRSRFSWQTVRHWRLHFERVHNQGMRCFSSASISKRDDAVTLQTVDGITVMVQGYLNRSRTLENGFSEEVCDDFLIGFPYYWEEFAALSVSEEPGNSSASKEVSPSDACKTPVQEARMDLAGGGNSSASKDVSRSDAYKTPVQEARTDLAGGPLTRSRARLLATRR